MTRKRCFLLALALAGPGCLGPMTHLDDEPRKTPPVQAVVKPAPPIVTPDEVNESNASEKARALAQELDYAASEHAASTPMTLTNETATKP